MTIVIKASVYLALVSTWQLLQEEPVMAKAAAFNKSEHIFKAWCSLIGDEMFKTM